MAPAYSKLASSLNTNKNTNQQQKYDRSKCEHEECFYSKDNKKRPTISYNSIMSFEKGLADKAVSMKRNGIEQSFVKEMQIKVNECDAIDSIFSKKELYFTFNVPDNETIVRLNICECCKVSLYQVEENSYYPSMRTYYRWKSTAKCMKTNLYCPVITNDKLSNNEKKKAKIDSKFKNLNDAKLYFNKKRGVNPSVDAMRELCIPNKPKWKEALKWLKEFIDLECQYPPNKSNLCELPSAIFSKKMVYELFEKTCQLQYTAAEHGYCTYNEFLIIWDRCYKNVKIRKYLAVTGKCRTCLSFHEAMLRCSTIDEFEDLEHFKLLHRIEVSMNNGAYYDDRLKAQTNPGKYFCIITDGWAVKRTSIPYLANLREYGQEVHQHIQGCKQHGLFRDLYRTMPHINTGTNLNITCIMDEILARIEYCEKNNKSFPTDLFIQVDGGPENVSKAFLAFGELLVRLNVFERVSINRLPVGHTHEDIDALFGSLWNYLKPWSIYTPQRFKELVEEAFKDNQHIDTRKTDKKSKEK